MEMTVPFPKESQHFMARKRVLEMSPEHVGQAGSGIVPSAGSCMYDLFYGSAHRPDDTHASAALCFHNPSNLVLTLLAGFMAREQSCFW